MDEEKKVVRVKGSRTHTLSPFESLSSSAVEGDKCTAKKAFTKSSNNVIDLDRSDEVVNIERRGGSEPSKSLDKTSVYSSTDSLNSTGRRSKTVWHCIYILFHVYTLMYMYVVCCM